jgi:spore germination protein YaaH
VSSRAAIPPPASATAAPIPPPPVIASIPYWDLGPGASAVAASPSRIDEISPWVYNVGPDGSVVSTTPPQDTATVNAAMATLRAQNAPIMPSVSNYVGDDFSYDAVAPVLHDPATMGRNMASITQLAVSQNYAGISLDYEELQAGDRPAFTTFVQQLAASLHAAHKTLAVSLFAKTDDAGDDPRNVAQDYAAIGAAADQVWLMTYDYHWDASPPGPVAPADWVHDVLAYATTQIPPQKLSVGLDTAGYDWVGNQGQVISYTQAMQLASSHGAAVQFDPTSQSPWFRYTASDGTAHEVWFENAASAQAKRSMAASFGVDSIFLWMYGPPDPALWPALARS